MMVKKYSSFLCALLALFIFLSIWVAASFEEWAADCCLSKNIGTLLGVAGYFIFSLSLLLSSRWKKLEDWIGGLDQIYHLHRHLGILGFVLILSHPWIIALKWISWHFDKFILFTLPIHERLSVNLGSWAYWMMIIILAVTLLKLLPYDKWKILHKFMSVVFLLSSFHILLSDRRFGSEFAQSLLLIPMAIGFWGILYKQVFFFLLVKRSLLEVVEVKKVNDNVLELTLHSKDGMLQFKPGQYGFFSFEGAFLTKESHPFTMIEIPDDANKIMILIKARGDFTENLFQNVKKGYFARFEGPYGRFDYSFSGGAQIWIAGGIGIVPFIAWKRAIEQTTIGDLKIDLYYCVHRYEDAVFLDEFKQFGLRYSGFRCFFHCSEENNRINVQKIAHSSQGVNGKKIFICGPMKLTRELKREFLKIGVKNENICFEDFEFF